MHSLTCLQLRNLLVCGLRTVVRYQMCQPDLNSSYVGGPRVDFYCLPMLGSEAFRARSVAPRHGQPATIVVQWAVSQVCRGAHEGLLECSERILKYVDSRSTRASLAKQTDGCTEVGHERFCFT